MHFFAPINEPQYEISNNVVCASTKGLDQSVHMRSLIRVFASCLKTIDQLAFEVSKPKEAAQARLSLFVPKCADPEGDMGSRPPWKITSYSYMGFYRNWQLEPPWKKLDPPPLENV